MDDTLEWTSQTGGILPGEIIRAVLSLLGPQDRWVVFGGISLKKLRWVKCHMLHHVAKIVPYIIICRLYICMISQIYPTSCWNYELVVPYPQRTIYHNKTSKNKSKPSRRRWHEMSLWQF